MEVHPPEHAIHSWRDFLVHMGTIVLGLLIAISLEQSVEALHRRHERRHLEEALRTEAEHNLRLTQQNIEKLRKQQQWVDLTLNSLADAPEQDGAFLWTVPAPPPEFEAFPFDVSQSAWTVARSSGTVALLPEDEAQVYDRLDHESEELIQLSRKYDTTYIDLQTFSRRLNLLASPGPHRFTPAQHEELLRLLAAASSATSQMKVMEWTEKGACEGVLHNVRTVDDMLRYVVDENKLGRQQDSTTP